MTQAAITQSRQLEVEAGFLKYRKITTRFTQKRKRGEGERATEGMLQRRRELLRVLKKGSNLQEEKSDLHEEKVNRQLRLRND